ncbi:cas scaffolding protein family member 4 isoform X2 [Brachyhypopomus gauderio]
MGWWRCVRQGQEGLAPANRLTLLPASESSAAHPGYLPARTQGIYQTPRALRTQDASPTYEVMERVCDETVVPVKQSPAGKTKIGPEVPMRNGPPRRLAHAVSSPKLDVYDVPSLTRAHSLTTMPSPQPTSQKLPGFPQSRYEVMDTFRLGQTTVYAVPPSVSQDPNYHTPPPSTAEVHGADTSCTLPHPPKSEWIYDVPLASKANFDRSGYHSTSRIVGKPRADTLPATLRPAIYDIPKFSVNAQQNSDGIYDIPPRARLREPPVDAAAQRRSFDDSYRTSEPLEYRGKSGPCPASSLPRGRPSWNVKPSVEPKGQKTRGLIVPASQRSSTASTSSSASSSSRSSCDSLMLSSPSPEPLREVVLSPEEVAQRLQQLQGAVCRAVPTLMDYVSSHWRCRDHLSRHLQEIRVAAEDVAHSVSSFLDFVLDVRGNAQRLTDSNLQARLQKQLSIVEDSGLILQQASDTLGGLGWPLDELALDPDQSQAPDQLERFVMVARTVPEDVKRLVSILNANGKLLFRNASKEQEPVKDISPSDTSTSSGKKDALSEPEGDDNDYVQLQTKTEFEEQHRMKEKDEKKTDANGENEKKQVSRPQPVNTTGKTQITRSSTLDHCRLYFGALKKAIGVFVKSLEEDQPPEKFIGHSKLVIMVGQRLMDSLCSEFQARPDSQEILCRSNHLCALLKQLAVATKKAALHFPDKVAVQEVRDFAKELSVWVQQFRLTLDI